MTGLREAVAGAYQAEAGASAWGPHLGLLTTPAVHSCRSADLEGPSLRRHRVRVGATLIPVCRPSAQDYTAVAVCLPGKPVVAFFEDEYRYDPGLGATCCLSSCCAVVPFD